MKKTLMCCVLFIVITIPSLAQLPWGNITCPQVPSNLGSWYYSLTTTDDLINIVGSRSFNGSGNFDNGFEVLPCPADSHGTSWRYNKIISVENDVMFMCGGSSLAIPTSIIHKSINDGDTWENVHWSENQYLYSIKFWDQATGIAVGKNGLVLKTINGGVDWTPITPFTDSNILDVDCSDNGLVMTVDESGDIWKSEDYGISWTSIEAMAECSALHGLFIADNGIILAVGRIGTIIRSDDNGESFRDIGYEPSRAQFEAVYLSPNGIGLVVGDESTILLSTDHGINWSPMEMETNFEESFNDVVILSDNSAYLCGDRGFIAYNPELAPTSAVEPLNNTPSEFTLEQNYPNPFNPTTSIRYSIPVSSLVTITVYNALGQEVANLVNELQPAGTHMVNWNGNNMPTSIYFYKMQANDFSLIQKMSLVK
jgi:photosystem II stability/assembly factor-like uncharacterized protein